MRAETSWGAGWRCFSGLAYCRTERPSATVLSVQPNSHVLRSIGTTALYCRAYNALGFAALHSTVLQLLSVAVLSLLYACDVSNAAKAVKGDVSTRNKTFYQTDQSDRSIMLGDGKGSNTLL